MRRKCIKCGIIFEGKSWRTLCADCSPEAKKSTVVRNRQCRQCGAIFEGGPRAWYCPDCRYERTRSHAKTARERAKSGTTRKLGSIDYCQRCGKEYIVNGGKQVYCPKCAPIAVAEKDKAAGREWYAKNRENANSARYEKRSQAAAAIPCAVCGNLFVPNTSAVVCSENCRKEYIKRQQKEYKQEHAEELNEYQRKRYKNRKKAR